MGDVISIRSDEELAEELREVLAQLLSHDRYKEGLTLAEILGVLEILKFNLLRGAA